MTCTLCDGAMLPEWGATFKRCPTCREQEAQYARRWGSTTEGRAKKKIAQRRYRETHRQTVRDYDRLVYTERRNDKVCVECETPVTGNTRCPVHREAHNRRALASYHRRKAA